MRLEVKDAAVGYKNHRLAEGINMTSEPGMITAILGPNGCGKTSFVKSLMGFLSWLSGGAFLDGVDMRTISEKKRWQQVAYVSQQSSNVPYSVLDMVLLGRNPYKSLLSQPDANDQKQAEAALDRVGMRSYSDTPYRILSAGQKQLVKIARALVGSQSLFIMDEPESGLDLKHSNLLLAIMKELCKDENKQILFITHSPENALMVADKTLLFLPQSQMSAKTVWGDTDCIVTVENLEKIYHVPLSIVRKDDFVGILQASGRLNREK